MIKKRSIGTTPACQLPTKILTQSTSPIAPCSLLQPQSCRPKSPETAYFCRAQAHAVPPLCPSVRMRISVPITCAACRGRHLPNGAALAAAACFRRRAFAHAVCSGRRVGGRHLRRSHRRLPQPSARRALASGIHLCLGRWLGRGWLPRGVDELVILNGPVGWVGFKARHQQVGQQHGGSYEQACPKQLVPSSLRAGKHGGQALHGLDNP